MAIYRLINIFFFSFLEYRSSCLSKIAMQKYDTDDATPDMFSTVSIYL